MTSSVSNLHLFEQQLCDNDSSMSHDATIELLKQSLEQLSVFTQQQQVAAEALLKRQQQEQQEQQAVEPSGFSTSESPAGVPPKSTRSSSSKTLSRRGSFCSQTSSASSTKSVRFGNVSIVTAVAQVTLSAEQSSITTTTTVDDFEQQSTARKQLGIQQQQLKKSKKSKETTTNESDVLDEYVKMAHSTRRRKSSQGSENQQSPPQLTRSVSLSALSPSQTATTRSLFTRFGKNGNHQTDQSLDAALKAVATARSPSVVVVPVAVDMELTHSPVVDDNINNNYNKSSKTTKSSSRRPLSGLTKMVSQRFDRRRAATPHYKVSRSNDIDMISKVVDDNETETSSNDDPVASCRSGFWGQGSQRTSRQTFDASSVVSTRSCSSRRRLLGGFRRSTAKTSIVEESGHSDISSSCRVFDESNTSHDDQGEESIIHHAAAAAAAAAGVNDEENAAQLQNDIADLKQQLMGLVMEHMEESERRKEQKQQLKRHYRLKSAVSG